MKHYMSLILGILFLASVAWSQVIIESELSSDGFYGVGGFTSTSKIFIEGDAKRSETQLKFTGGIMRHFSPKGTEIEITRLDKQVIWEFNDRDKKYTETSFDKMKALFESGDTGYDMPEQEQESPEQEQTEEEYEWQEPVYEVKKLETGVKVAGMNCDHYLATITTIGTHKATGIQDTMLFKGDFWNSLQNSKEMQVANDFEERLAKALGFEQLGNRAMAQFKTAFEEQAKELGKSLQEMKGYPLKMDMVYNMTTHAYAQQAAEAEKENQDEGSDTDITDVKGALGGLFGKKIAKMAQESVAPKQDGPKMLFKSSYQVTNIKSENVSADKFSVPSNYKLTE